jgi:hypothetical protein
MLPTPSASAPGARQQAAGWPTTMGLAQGASGSEATHFTSDQLIPICRAVLAYVVLQRQG